MPHNNNSAIPLVSNPSSQQVTSSQAFSTGAGNRNNANIYDGTGNGGTDIYKCYYGSYTGFPPSSQWIEFDDMFNYAKNALTASCSNVASTGPGDSGEQIGQIYNAIQQVAESSLVDHRFILAVILQEVSLCFIFSQIGGFDECTVHRLRKRCYHTKSRSIGAK